MVPVTDLPVQSMFLGAVAERAEVDPQKLAAAGLLKGGGERPVVLLGNGDIKQPLTIKVHRASKSAVQKVEAAGGKVELPVAKKA